MDCGWGRHHMLAALLTVLFWVPLLCFPLSNRLSDSSANLFENKEIQISLSLSPAREALLFESQTPSQLSSDSVPVSTEAGPLVPEAQSLPKTLNKENPETAPSEGESSLYNSGEAPAFENAVIDERGRVAKAENQRKTNPNEELFKLKLREALAREQVYPVSARRAGIEGSVLMSLRVAMNGELESVSIVEGSGSRVLDSAALRLARRVFPIQGELQEGLETKVSIVYRLK